MTEQSGEQLTRLLTWEQSLTDERWWARCFEKSGSTMELARAELLANPAQKLPRLGMVLTHRMYGGRGRHGRVWESPEEGFYATFVWETTLQPAVLSGLSLVIGVAVRDALLKLGCETLLKWPNDLLGLSRKKLSGVLIEVSSSPQSSTVFIGLGINLRGEPASVKEISTSIFTESGKPLSPIEIAAALLPKLVSALELFERSGFAPFQEPWERVAFGIGKSIQFERGAGEILQGMLCGVDEQGRLLIKNEDGIIACGVGEIHSVRVVEGI